MPGLYDTTTLLEVMRVQKTSVPHFWLTFFNSQINFETASITWDKVYGDNRKLAPFVIPTVQGRPQRLEGYETVQFQPAYVKIKDVVHAEMHMERMPGEALGTGSMSIDQRRDAVIGYLLGMQKVKFANREEWLASKAIIDGKVTIAGEDYPSVLVDFRRDASLTSVLAGGAAWGQATGDPLTTLRTMRMAANAKSGARITKHIFGQQAWDKFATNPNVDLKEMMNSTYGGLDVKVTRMYDGYEGMEFVGVIQGLNGAGKIEAWINTSKYIDELGAEQYYLNQNAVVGVSDMVQGVRCYGAIMDKKAGFKPLTYFSKNWENEDPSVEYLLSQSAPLMVPKEPNATFYLDVGP
jgi:Phage major capsid protein E